MPVNQTAAVVARQYSSAVTVGVGSGLGRAVKNGLERELPVTVRALGQALSERLLPRPEMEAINKRIAGHAQDAVLAGLRSRLPRGGVSSRRSELSGTLESALASESMIQGSTDRVISFVNPRTLGQQAKHWYRVNYGAAGPNFAKPGGQTPETYIVNLNGRPIMTLRDNHGPARLSYLPRSFIWSGNDFVVTRGPAKATGRGSRPARFLDPGYHQVAVEFGPAYITFFNKWVKTAKGRAKLQAKGIETLADVRVESIGITVTVS